MKFNQEQLEIFEKKILEKGYKKYQGHFKKEDYAYWKSFDVTYDEDGGKKVGYQIALMVYDFGKYLQNTDVLPISISFEFILGNYDNIGRVDLSISDDKLSVTDFEQICDNFYTTICKQWK